MNIVRIAMDGPAGAGKSTIAKRVARELGIDYIDTGAMYRAFALKILRTGTDVNDADALAALLKDTDVDYAGGSIFLDGENVDGLIRTPEVSEMASVSSAVQAVRDKLVAAQQAMGKRKSLVMDGRDIGSKVFPDAELKFYITASSRIRAERRAIDMELAGQPCDVDQIQKDIEARDYRDMHRASSPLVKVPDAIEIDTTDASLEESVAEVMHYINKFLSKEDQGE
ncbi:MAG: (d)CMP kinase [Firmicutes bacterium]|nr:(d)CMP kinase [Bacillota bacterium]